MASKAALEALYAKEKAMQEELEKYRGTQKDLQKCMSSRTQLDGQLIENKNVKEVGHTDSALHEQQQQRGDNLDKMELDLLEDDAVVYKLVGPVLVKQDLSEAKQTVEKRLDYITKELERYDSMIKELERKQESQTERLARLQQDYKQSIMKAGIVR